MAFSTILLVLALFEPTLATIPNLCCANVLLALGKKVSFPKSAPYNQSLASYWSQQEEQVTPSCIVSPQTAADVATAVRVLTLLPICDFAIRSGGHTAQAGSANIQDGVTIDLSALKTITPSADKTSVVVGPGQRWANVYTALAPYNVTVAGGRAGNVGVGGQVIGGGISYFAPKAGFTCDNVLSFQVVLADGRIVIASASSNADLYRALKGGSNNFGVVTQYTFKTIKIGKIYAGNIIYPATTIVPQLQAFSNFISNASYDENAAIMQSYAFAPSVGALVVNQPIYALPVPNPSIFAPFTSIQPQFANSASVTDLPSFSIEDGALSPSQFYQLTFATSFDQSVDMLTKVFNIWNNSTAQVAAVTGISWSLSTQPLNKAIVSKAAATGGNSLGLPSSFRTGSLVLAILSATWSSGSDSALIQSAANKLLADIIRATKSAGAFNPYIDLNHANDGQDPIAGYGPTVKTQLELVALKYDPFRFFQRNVPGGFKLCPK